ncbi:MAG: hypothetical protein K6T85_01725 [Gorillibacterium sp.]|nr:hypothetical protein [Gorillibacterium sp.]
MVTKRTVAIVALAAFVMGCATVGTLLNHFDSMAVARIQSVYDLLVNRLHQQPTTTIRLAVVLSDLVLSLSKGEITPSTIKNMELAAQLVGELMYDQHYSSQSHH